MCECAADLSLGVAGNSWLQAAVLTPFLLVPFDDLGAMQSMALPRGSASSGCASSLSADCGWRAAAWHPAKLRRVEDSRHLVGSLCAQGTPQLEQRCAGAGCSNKLGVLCATTRALAYSFVKVDAIPDLRPEVDAAVAAGLSNCLTATNLGIGKRIQVSWTYPLVLVV